MEPVKVGIIGCGAISNQYLDNAKKYPILNVVALADLDLDRAKSQAAKYGIAKACTVEELIADPSIEVSLNLTIPAAHVPISLQSLEAGKHTFSEKPLGVTRDEGRKLVDAAANKGLRVGCAPDTFLGAGIQTARKLIDDGAIGKPVAFTAFWLSRGHEHWHPSPEFFYEPGGGPMFDMGPYYITALMQMFGPIRRVNAFTSIAIPERTILSKPKFGKRVVGQTPDHYSCSMEFENGVIGTLVTSFATRAASYDGKFPIHVFGDAGAIKMPDPNYFDGPVMYCKFGEKDEYEEVPHTFVTGYGRAIGLADMASAIRNKRPHRCSLDQSFGVLDAMQGFMDSSVTGQAIMMTPGYVRPAPMNGKLPFGALD
jgi:predicted dehydrogenase